MRFLRTVYGLTRLLPGFVLTTYGLTRLLPGFVLTAYGLTRLSFARRLRVFISIGRRQEHATIPLSMHVRVRVCERVGICAHALRRIPAYMYGTEILVS